MIVYVADYFYHTVSRADDSELSEWDSSGTTLVRDWDQFETEEKAWRALVDDAEHSLKKVESRLIEIRKEVEHLAKVKAEAKFRRAQALKSLKKLGATP